MRLYLLLLLLPLLLPSSAAAEEGGGIPSPTRIPGAIEYDSAHPERLLPEQLVAHSYVLMEMETGDILMQRNADDLMYPASTTKALTALITLEHLANTLEPGQTLDDALKRQMTVSETAVDIPSDASSAGLRANDSISIIDALYGMMLKSGNDAANAIAEYISGSQEAFVEYMNAAVSAFGLNNSHFANPHGYHDPDHYSTALDMAAIARIAMRSPIYRKIVSTVDYTITTGVRRPLNLHNTNRLIDTSNSTYYYPYATGGKTGSHSMAAYSLIATAEKNGVTLLVVLMYSGDYSRWADAKRLFEYGFTQYTSYTPEQIYAKDPFTIQTTSFATTDENRGELTLDLEAIDPTETARVTGPNDVVEALADSYRSYTSITWTRGRQPRAPIYKGEVLGVMTFYTPSGDAPKYNLIAPRDVAIRGNAPLTIDELEEMSRVNPLSFPPLSWDWLTPPVIVFAMSALTLRTVARFFRNSRREARQLPKPKRRTYR